MAFNAQRFWGGSPASVLVKLIFLSLLVGAFLSFLGITPMGVVDRVLGLVQSVLDRGFDSIGEVGRWILSGAIIVLPIWIIMRLFSAGR